MIPLKNNIYDNRSTHSVGTYFRRTNAFKYSFFPYTIREWNKLDLQVRNEKSFKKFWNTSLKGCLYEKNHATQVKRLTLVRSRQNGVFHFVKANRLYENGFIPPSWDLTSTQVRSHLGGMIFFHVNSFCQAVPPRQDCSFSLDSACFYIYYVTKCNSS